MISDVVDINTTLTKMNDLRLLKKTLMCLNSLYTSERCGGDMQQSLSFDGVSTTGLTHPKLFSNYNFFSFPAVLLSFRNLVTQ
jgi:hypothetical protein